MADNSPAKEFLIERDYRIYKMKLNGTSPQEIAKRLGITGAAVQAAIKRQVDRMNRDFFLDNPGLLRLELERLDQLQQAVWPMTQHRMVKMPDGTQITVEPDVKFVAEARNIIKDRIKLLGLEQTTVNVNVEGEPVRSSLQGVVKPLEQSTHDPKAETIALLQVMRESGILSKEAVDALIGAEDEILELESGVEDTGRSDGATTPSEVLDSWD